MRVELLYFPPCLDDVPIHSIKHLKGMTLMMSMMEHFELVMYSILLKYAQFAKMVKQPVTNMEINLFPRNTMS